VREYDLIAEWYASERADQTGVPEVTALASSLPRGARVLDVGCGNGIPITRALLSAGHGVVGVDSSTEMLARVRRNCPDPNDGTRAIASVSRILKSGAPFLFTSGDVDGFDGKEDTMNGVVFRYLARKSA
jgi:SAM-dependent methyltransferase